MKKTIVLLFSCMAFYGNSQLVIDDFSTGEMNQINNTVIEETAYNQTGNGILNKKRGVLIKVNENPDKQFFQTKIVKGRLIASIGYGIVGVVELRYGYDSADFLNLDLTKFKNIHIEYEAKSNFGRVYVSLFSNGPNRALWRGSDRTIELYQGSISSNGSNRPFILKIPLTEFTMAQDNKEVENTFTMIDVDFFKIQFIAQGKQGLNFAIKKIWLD